MTGRTFIYRALRSVNAVGRAQSVPGEVEAESLDFLNMLMRTLRRDGLYSSAWVRQSYTMTANLQTHTVGPTGTFVQTYRPVHIDRAAVKSSGSNSEIPLHLYTRQEWAAITDKTMTGTLPEGIHYESGDGPNGTILSWPIQTSAAILVLEETTALPEFATVNTDVTLTEEAEPAIIYNLAVLLGPSQGRVVSKEIRDLAEDSLTKWAMKNIPLEEAQIRRSPWRETSGAGGFNIKTGR